MFLVFAPLFCSRSVLGPLFFFFFWVFLFLFLPFGAEASCCSCCGSLFWACFGAPFLFGGSKKGFLGFFFGVFFCLVPWGACFSFLLGLFSVPALFWGPVGLLRKDFFGVFR